MSNPLIDSNRIIESYLKSYVLEDAIRMLLDRFQGSNEIERENLFVSALMAYVASSAFRKNGEGQ